MKIITRDITIETILYIRALVAIRSLCVLIKIAHANTVSNSEAHILKVRTRSKLLMFTILCIDVTSMVNKNILVKNSVSRFSIFFNQHLI